MVGFPKQICGSPTIRSRSSDDVMAASLPYHLAFGSCVVESTTTGGANAAALELSDTGMATGTLGLRGHGILLVQNADNDGTADRNERRRRTRTNYTSPPPRMGQRARPLCRSSSSCQLIGTLSAPSCVAPLHPTRLARYRERCRSSDLESEEGLKDFASEA